MPIQFLFITLIICHLIDMCQKVNGSSMIDVGHDTIMNDYPHLPAFSTPHSSIVEILARRTG